MTHPLPKRELPPLKKGRIEGGVSKTESDEQGWLGSGGWVSATGWGWGGGREKDFYVLGHWVLGLEKGSKKKKKGSRLEER